MNKRSTKKNNQQKVIQFGIKYMMCTKYLNKTRPRTLSPSIKIKNQHEMCHHIEFFIPVAIQTLCFLFVACGSLFLFRYLFILAHSFVAKNRYSFILTRSFIAKIRWKTLFVSTPHYTIELTPLRFNSKIHRIKLTQVRASLSLYVVSSALSINS